VLGPGPLNPLWGGSWRRPLPRCSNEDCWRKLGSTPCPKNRGIKATYVASQGEHHRRWWPHCNWSDPPSARPSLPTEPTITELRHPTALWLIMWVNPIGSTIPGGRNHRSICLGQLALLYSHNFGMVLGKSILHGELDVKSLRCQKIWTSFVNSNVAMATPLQMPTVN